MHCNPSHWDFVVLQEQSQIPAAEPVRSQEMYPAARILVQKIRQTGAQPIFFLIGASGRAGPKTIWWNYESMQLQVTRGI